MRANGQSGEEGYFYMPAEPTLVEYAQRLADDIPKNNVVKFDVMSTSNGIGLDEQNAESKMPTLQLGTEIFMETPSTLPTSLSRPPDPPGSPSVLELSYEATLNVFGRFRQELLAINGLDQKSLDSGQ